ncbi:MAG: hypothetical protein A2Z24_01500 [Candidatus Woykebacteria bacterium RBG_16_44_10]|uniref:Uncharacterized protein n=1 Tax=Candidatus Woykebacteria bacterium RBG_16_44_10 TaxID=1802597 RepID=A0A1G1WEU3_9BACT|nr:MAG: hypothetical protein A2Z24_01500 [Candidatus Woykebacteria bacterium RBG_16_44_10]
MGIPFKLAYNTAVQLVGKAVTATSTLLITYLVAKNFPIEGYGGYTAILSYIALFYVFADFGLNAVFVRETGSDQEKQKDYFKNLLGLRLVVSILVAFVATAILAFTGHPAAVKLGIIVALGLIVTQSFAATALALFQTKIRYDLAVIADSLGAAATLVFVYLAATNFKSILFVIAALVIGGVVRVLVAFYIVRFQFGALTIAFNIGFWRRLVLAAIPIGLIAIFSQFNAQIDKQIILLAQYKTSLNLNGELAAGIYGLSYKIFELAIVLPSFIMNVGYPIMVQKKEEGVTLLLRFTKKLAAVLLALGFFGLILGWFLVPFIFKVPGLEKFSVSTATTRILLLGFPLFFITPATLWLAVTLNKTREMMFIYGFAAFFNLVANLVFVPAFGYNAAAVVTIASELLILALSLGVLSVAFRSRET